MRSPDAFGLTASAGAPIPVQSWPLAYWPDGSLKWTGHAVGADAALDGNARLAVGDAAAVPQIPVTVATEGAGIVLANGVVTVRLASTGPVVLRQLSRDGRAAAQDGQLVLRLQDRPEEDRAGARETVAYGMVTSAVVEQSGPVRAVVRLAGEYVGPNGALGFPWTLRVYLYAGAESIRVMHSFVFDADPAGSFIRGLGLQVQVPMTDELHDRHIRFAGSDGAVWGEPVRVLTGLVRDHGADARTRQIPVRAAQVAGTPTPPVSEWSEEVRANYQNLAVWNDFTLAQNSPTHFAVWKRTSAAASWLTHAGHGDRAAGLGYVGGISGGLAFGMRDLWQQFPRALDIRAAAGDTAAVTIWSWSPHAPVMDLRPYDAGGHGLALAYEDNRDGFVLLGLLLWTAIPMVLSFCYSFTRYDLPRKPHFNGVDNYRTP